VLKYAHIPYILAFHLQTDADSDPAHHFDADADPDPAHHFEEDLDPTFQFDADPIHNTEDHTKIRSLDSLVNGNMQSIIRSYISYLQLPRSLHLSPTIQPYNQS
jgi:hypothetical protein